MALSDYTPAKRAVEHNGKTLVEVRGLSLEDVTILMRNHIADIRAAYDMWDSDFRKLLPVSPIDIENLVIGLIMMFPVTVRRMIAVAADEPQNEEYVRLMPLPLQVKIVAEIVEQTFEDVGGPLVFAAAMRVKLQMMLPFPPETTPSRFSTAN